MDPLTETPAWLLRPIPANATDDEKLHERIDKLAAKLPGTMDEMNRELFKVRMYAEYDAAANRAVAHVWRAREQFFASPSPAVRASLLHFAIEHMPAQARARILRRLARDADFLLRRKVRRLVERGGIREVALPAKRDGDWDPTGWLKGVAVGPLSRHRTGARVQQQKGVPPIPNLARLRELLGIRSPQQLGYFLVASDAGDGPYTKFTIPKRDGSEREICAPKKQLRWVQRQILEKILGQVPVHEAAHGFVTGRSTVTNAAPHKGAELILKFDLTDFFPTIHYHRVVGLFASLGYGVGDTRFATADDATQVAPTLARLCCHTEDPEAWGGGRLPQGAPTSPALSNLVCRRLDARLAGLARRNQGIYTRYADDLTFSFPKDEVDLGRFRWWVDQVCHQEGFFVHQGKFRVIRASQRQVVTGIVVNDELRVPREARRRFRATLHNCRTHGVASQARDHPRFKAYLRGFASYVHMVHPDEGTELLRQVEELLGSECDEGEGD
jgi:retron-type reverse transcriptase